MSTKSSFVFDQFNNSSHKFDLRLVSARFPAFDSYRERALANLHEQVRLLGNRLEPRRTIISDLNPLDLIFCESPKDIRLGFDLPKDGNQCIYIFKFENQFQSVDQVHQFIAEVTEMRKNDRDGHKQVTGVKTGKLKGRVLNPDFVVLYVGTAQDIATRLKEHVGHMNKGISTILLRKWPCFRRENPLKLSFEVFDFGAEQMPEALKLIEYFTSEDLRPLIGHNRRT